MALPARPSRLSSSSCSPVSAGIGLGLIAHESPVSEAVVANRPVQVPANGYVSSQTCQACHPSEYATWHASYHRTMTQVATPETVVADFDRVQVTDVPGRPMVLERRGTELWAELDDPDWDGHGPAPPRIERQVVMTTGSHNQQIYWYATGRNRTLGQLPAIQFVGERRWIPRRSAVMHPPGQALISETGSWNGICVDCHTTSGKAAFDTPFGSQPIDTQVVDTKAAEFGISCEAVSRTERRARAAEPQPAAAVPASPDQPAGSLDGSAAATRPAPVVPGLRPVSRLFGSSTISKARDKPTREAFPIGPATSSRHALHRAADHEPRLADDEVAARGRSGHGPRHVLVRRHGARHRAGVQRADRVAVFQERHRRRARCRASRATRCTRRPTTSALSPRGPTVN